ncbi:MAG: cytochrome c oxidase assembly factor 1 family protein [Planctomycetaceae bacterium]|nr:cytochrome c oxidase assembly factor 1 family protein [Planctomycetaceae bacterium]
MSVNPIAAAGKDTEVKQPKRQRGWFGRNWLWFVPALILFLVVVGAGALYWSFYVRIYRLDVVQDATTVIKADKSLREKLGEPIHKLWLPSREAMPAARIEDREKDVRWKIRGPKGTAEVHVLSQMRLGEWQRVVFDVTLPDGKKISLQQADEGGEAPPAQFKPTKPADKTPSTKTPPPDINLPLPSADSAG